MSSLWLKGGSVLRDPAGAVYLCPECPCVSGGQCVAPSYPCLPNGVPSPAFCTFSVDPACRSAMGYPWITDAQWDHLDGLTLELSTANPALLAPIPPEGVAGVLANGNDTFASEDPFAAGTAPTYFMDTTVGLFCRPGADGATQQFVRFGMLFRPGIGGEVSRLTASACDGAHVETGTCSGGVILALALEVCFLNGVGGPFPPGGEFGRCTITLTFTG